MRRLAALLPVLALLAGAAAPGLRARADTPGAPGAPAPEIPPPATVLPPGATAMSPAQFEAFATGRTLVYAEYGTVWGRETYLPGRKVMWRAVGEDCKLGRWWPEGGAICFGYDDGKAPQCWAFARGPGGLVARFLGDPAAPPAQVTEQKDPVPCPGPAIGS